MDPSSMLGPLDALAPYVEWIVVALVVLNMITRIVAHRSYVQAAEDGGAEAISRHLGHEGSNVLLVLGAFYYLSLHHHGGMVLSTMVLGLVVTDFFEFEARKVEARTDEPLDSPKAAVAASLLVLAYALFQAAFYLVQPYWRAVV